MQAGPSLDADRLAATLISSGTLDETSLASLLGPDRHRPTVNRLEVALERSGVMSRRQLLELIRATSGCDVLDVDAAVMAEVLPEQVARATGSLVVSVDPPVVAMVEDLPEHLTRLSAHLGGAVPEVRLMTALQFDELRRAGYSGAAAPSAVEATSVFEIFDQAVEQGASDVHMKVGVAPSLRVDGSTRVLSYAPVTADWLREEIVQLSSEEVWDRLLREHDVDFAFEYGVHRFRLNLGQDRYGPTLVARKLAGTIPSPDDLELPRPVREFIRLDSGLVLVVGATGSGKSTTLAALLAEICRSQDRHVITLEQPIEFILPRARALVSQREFGTSFSSFASGLRQALRQDPDVILVGELRDTETMRAALNAAETGHLVFATVHAYDATSTLARVVNSFPAEEQDQVRAQLSYILKGVVAQKLVPLAHTRGRVAAYEVLLNIPSVAANLRKVDGLNAIGQAMETGVRQGLQTMDMALAQLVSRDLVSFEQAERRSSDPAAFRRLVDQLGGAGPGVQAPPSRAGM